MTEPLMTIEPAAERVRIVFNGEAIADSRHALLLHERNHAPVYYIPRADAKMGLLKRTEHSSH